MENIKHDKMKISKNVSFYTNFKNIQILKTYKTNVQVVKNIKTRECIGMAYITFRMAVPWGRREGGVRGIYCTCNVLFIFLI